MFLVKKKIPFEAHIIIRRYLYGNINVAKNLILNEKKTNTITRTFMIIMPLFSKRWCVYTVWVSFTSSVILQAECKLRLSNEGSPKICIKYSKYGRSSFSSTIDCKCLAYFDPKRTF